MKERLTGAFILLALIVLLVPELLTGPIRPAPLAQRAGADTGEARLRTYTINLEEDGRGASPAQPPAPAPASATAAGPGTAESAQPPAPGAQSAAPPAVTPATPVVSPVRAATTPPPAPQAAATSRDVRPPVTPQESDGWVIQLGSFASRANAERLAQQVRARGFQVSVSRSSTGRHLYRVRVGPAHDRAAAAQLQAKLRATGHGGPIVPK